MNTSELGGDSGEQRLEDATAIGGSDEIFHGALGVGHEAEHVSFRADDAGDVAHRTVRIRFRIRNAVLVDVAEHDASLALEKIERLLIGSEASVAVRDRNAQHISDLTARGED